MILTKQNSNDEGSKSMLNFGHAWYHLVQKRQSSCLHPKNMAIKMSRTLLLLAVL
jgi:3-dehydroquinate synthetase